MKIIAGLGVLIIAVMIALAVGIALATSSLPKPISGTLCIVFSLGVMAYADHLIKKLWEL
jgi:hypothetical protein